MRVRSHDKKVRSNDGCSKVLCGILRLLRWRWGTMAYLIFCLILEYVCLKNRGLTVRNKLRLNETVIVLIESSLMII